MSGLELNHVVAQYGIVKVTIHRKICTIYLPVCMLLDQNQIAEEVMLYL